MVGLGVVDTSYRRRMRRLLFSQDDEEDGEFDEDDDGDAYYESLRRQVLSFHRWNANARPCNVLAHAVAFERNLSIVDMDVLQGCVYWRKVGMEAITSKELNLTSVIAKEDLDDASRIFMSLEDFASVVSSRY